MRVYLSATGDLKDCRASFAAELRAMGVDVRGQEDFLREGGSLLEKVENYIDGCDRVILLIGDSYGYEVPKAGVDPTGTEQHPRSYSQWEYHIAMGERLSGARKPRKPSDLYFANDALRRDRRLAQPAAHALRQSAFIEDVRAAGHESHEFGSLDELCRLATRDAFDLPQPPSQAASAGAITSYLRALISHLDRIDIASPSQVLRAPSATVRAPALIESACTKSRVRRVTQLSDTLNGLDLSPTERDVFAALDDAGRRVVLLGPPGSGKTTVARWLSIRQARASLGGRSYGVPIYIPLRAMDVTSLQSIDDLIDNALGPLLLADAGAASQYLKEYRNRLVVVIDGMDEVPARSRAGESRTRSIQHLLVLLDDIIESYAGHQVLITSRIQDYLHNRELQYPSAEHLLISDLTIEQIDESVVGWHRTAQRISVSAQDRTADWTSRGSEIRSLIRSDPDLASFAANPLCLNLLQLVYERSDRRHLSISRICETAIIGLLSSRADQSVPHQMADVGLMAMTYPELLLSVLSDIAVEAVDSIATGGDGAVPFISLQSSVTARVGADTATGFLQYGSLVHPIMSEIVKGQSVLISMNAQSFMFAHSLFRDVLAGRALKSMPPAESRIRASLPAWTRVFRHLAGLALGNPDGVHGAVAMAHALFEDSNQSDDIVALAASAEVVGEIRIHSDAFKEITLFREFLYRLTARLIVCATDENVQSAERVALGILLGRIGDPRTMHASLDLDRRDGFVRLPEAEVDLGGIDVFSIGHPKYRGVYPSSRQSFEFGAFKMSRYPVTNDEYAEFIADAGYSNEDYWTVIGRRWLNEDADTIGRLKELMKTTSMTHFYTDLENGRITEPEIDGEIEAMLFRKLPLFWYDRRLNGPNQPIVGVNWWEAKAYARWFQVRRVGGLRAGSRVDLPTEYEWERAARQRRRNAADTIWDSGAAEHHAHWNALHRLAPAPAPVGIYPWGSPSSDGPHDLIGNVWEWTTSLRRDYDARWIHEPFDNAGLEDRIVRGGSWLSAEPLSATIAFRSFDPPCNAFDDLGLRIAIVDR